MKLITKSHKSHLTSAIPGAIVTKSNVTFRCVSDGAERARGRVTEDRWQWCRLIKMTSGLGDSMTPYLSRPGSPSPEVTKSILIIKRLALFAGK